MLLSGDFCRCFCLTAQYTEANAEIDMAAKSTLGIVASETDGRASTVSRWPPFV